MRIKTIEMEGFQSYLDREVVDLDGQTLVAVIGPNGAGKSTLLNAIEFALFGKFRGDSIGSVIARSAKQAQVAIEFILNDSTYRVRRVKSGSRHEVYVSIADADAPDGWRPLEEKNPKMADPFLIDLVGMDYATARATWLIGQGDFGAFCELRPADRRTVLTNAFGLNRYEELAKRADEKRIVAEQGAAVAQGKLDEAVRRRDALLGSVGDAELHGLTDEDLREQDEQLAAEDTTVSKALAADLGDVDAHAKAVDAAERSLREFLGAHEKEAARHHEDVQRARNAVTQAQGAVKQADQHLARAKAMVEGATTRRDEASAAAWGIDDARDDAEAAQKAVAAAEGVLPALREEVTAWNSAASGHDARKASAFAQAKEVNERIATLKRTAHGHEGECFACGQPLSDDRAAQMLASLEQEKLALREQFEQAETDRAKAETAAGNASRQVARAESAVRTAREAAKVTDRVLADIQRAAAEVPQAEAALADAKKDATEFAAGAEKARLVLGESEAAAAAAAATAPPVLDEERTGQLRADIAAAQERLAAAKNANGDRQALRARRDALRARQKRVWAEQAHRKRVAQELDDLKAPLAAMEKEHAAVTYDAVHYLALRDAFRPAGIPSMILSGVVEELNDDANDILMDLGGQFGVNVTTQKESAKGGVDEKVMVYVTTAEGEIDYSTLSGSEKFRCALAIRIALARCIARRTGTPIETIVMDEGWGALDEEYRQAVLEVLTELSADFAVYTVSHIEEIKASFPTVIEVDKAEGTSRAVVVSR